MPASVDNESEILLGNKQLLAVFAVVAILLAVAFTTGYMLGKNSVAKTPGSGLDSSQTSTAAPETSGGPITQKVAPDDSQPARTASEAVESSAAVEQPKAVPVTPKPLTKQPIVINKDSVSARNTQAAPKTGENYVQVTAVTRKVAETTADVLRQHGFSARIGPAPGNPGIFRVLVGPAKDAAELRNTEDKLRKIGYTKCFIQHY